MRVCGARPASQRRPPPPAVTGRLFASAKNINTVFVLNTSSGRLEHALPVHAPQGLRITAKAGSRLLWVGSDDNGILSAYDADSYALVATRNFSTAPDSGEADDLLVDPVTQDVLVSVGDDGPDSSDPAAVATVSVSGALLSSIPVPAHVEGFELVPGTDLILANAPNAPAAQRVLVLDRRTRAVRTTYALPPGVSGNVPMAYDARRQHLMLGCHAPPSLVVLDMARGAAQVFAGPAPDDLDDMWLDEGAGLLFLSGGGKTLSTGAIAVYETPRAGAGNDTYVARGTITPAGKNSVLDTRARRLFTTVPAVDADTPAFVQVYKY